MSNFYREHINSSVEESCTLQRIKYFDTPYHVFLLGTFYSRSVPTTDNFNNNNNNNNNKEDCALDVDKESYRLLTFTKVNYNEVCKSKLSCCCSSTTNTFQPYQKRVNVNDLLVYSLRSSELSRDEAHTFVNSFHDNCLRRGNRELTVSCGESVGILGCVRFTQGYYLILASERTHVASIRTCNVYEVNNYILLPLMAEMPDKYTEMNYLALQEQSPLTLFQEAPIQTPSASSFLSLSWWTNWGSSNNATKNNNNDENKKRSSSSSLHYTQTQKLHKHRNTKHAHGLKRLSSRIANAAAPYLFNTRTSEDHYVEQFLANNMKHSFYYAHGYDLTNTLQANSCSNGCNNVKVLSRRMKYVWNTFLLEPFAIYTGESENKCCSLKHEHVNKYGNNNSSRKRKVKSSFVGENDLTFPSGLSCWLLYCIHGAITQQVITPHYCSVESTSHETSINKGNFIVIKSNGGANRETLLQTTNDTSFTSVLPPPRECRLLHVILIARVSKEFAGTRYLRRGVSADGRVANHVEIEQIVCVGKEKMSQEKQTTSTTPSLSMYVETQTNKNTEKQNEGSMKEHENEEYEEEEHSVNCTSYVQVRGSVPVRWFHPQTSLPKPPIEIGFSDLVDSSTIAHFQELICDYGTPVIVMNLVRQHERHERESALGKVYCAVMDKLQSAVEYDKLKYYHYHHYHHQKQKMNGSESNSNKNVLYYRAIDLKHVADQAWNVVTATAESDMNKTGIYAGSLCSKTNASSRKRDTHNTESNKKECWDLHKQIQCGVVRTNCIDCIDRTNIGQFIYGLHALGVQLHALGYLAESTDLIASHVLQETLLTMYFTLGDALATQYGGSAHVGAGVLHRGAGWDQLMGMKRLYHNVLGDKTKQVALNLFLGRFQPYPLQLSREMNLYMALPFQVHHLQQLRQIQHANKLNKHEKKEESLEEHKKRRNVKKKKKKGNVVTVVPSAMQIQSTAQTKESNALQNKNITFYQSDTTDVELCDIDNKNIKLNSKDITNELSRNRETNYSKCLESKCSETSTSSTTSDSSYSSSSSSSEQDNERTMRKANHEGHHKITQKTKSYSDNNNESAKEFTDKQRPMHLSTAQSFLARFFVGKKRPLLHHHHHHHHHHHVDYLSSSSSSSEKHVDNQSTPLSDLHSSDKIDLADQTNNCEDDMNSRSNTNSGINQNDLQIADFTCNVIEDYGSDVQIDLINESEGDYYLHSQQTPCLPNLALWRNWWKAPLQCYNWKYFNNSVEPYNTNYHKDNMTTEKQCETVLSTNTRNEYTTEISNDITDDLVLSHSHSNTNNNKSKSNVTKGEYNISHLYRSGKYEINLPMEEFVKSEVQTKVNVNVHITPEKTVASTLSEQPTEHAKVELVIAFVATCGEEQHSSASVNTTDNSAFSEINVKANTTQLRDISNFLQALQRRSVENLTYFSSSQPMVEELSMIFGETFEENNTNNNSSIENYQNDFTNCEENVNSGVSVYNNNNTPHNNDRMCEFTVQHCNFAKEVHNSLYEDNSSYYKNMSSRCLDALTYDEACRFVFITFGQPLEWDVDTLCDALIAYAPDLSQSTLYTIRNTLQWTGNDIVKNTINTELIENDKQVITQFITHVQKYANEESELYERSCKCTSGTIYKTTPSSSMHKVYCVQYEQALHKIVKHFFKFDVQIDQVYRVLQTFVSRMTSVETGLRCQSFTRYTDTFPSHDKHKSHIPLARVIKYAFSLEMLIDWLYNSAQHCHLRLAQECTMHGQENKNLKEAWEMVEFLYNMSIIVPVVQLIPNSYDDSNNNDDHMEKVLVKQIQLHDKTALFRFGNNVKWFCSNIYVASNNDNSNVFWFIMNNAPQKWKTENRQESHNKSTNSMHRSVSHVVCFTDACQLSESWAGIALNMFTSLRKHIYGSNNNNNMIKPRAILLSERATLVASLLHEMNVLTRIFTEISCDVSTFQGILTSHYVIAFFINVFNILYIHTWMLLYCVELHSLMVALAVPVDAARELYSVVAAAASISHFTSSEMYNSLWKSNSNDLSNAITIDESMFYEGFGYVIGKKESATHWHLTLSSIKNGILRCNTLPASYTCLPAFVQSSTIWKKSKTHCKFVDVSHCANNFNYCAHVNNASNIINDDKDEYQEEEEEEDTCINSLVESDCKTVTEYIRNHALVLCERHHCHRITRTTHNVSPTEHSAEIINQVCNAWIANMNTDRVQRRIALALLDTYVPPSLTLPNVTESATHSTTHDLLEYFAHEHYSSNENSEFWSSEKKNCNAGARTFDDTNNSSVSCNNINSENDKTYFTKGKECNNSSIDTNGEVDLWNWSRKSDFFVKESVDRHIFTWHATNTNNNNGYNEGSKKNNEVNISSKERWEHLCCPVQPAQLYKQLHDIEFNFLHVLHSHNHSTLQHSPLSDIMSVLTSQYTSVFGTTSHNVRTILEEDCECIDALHEEQYKLQQSLRAA